MQTLSHADTYHTRSAEGWLELGNYTEANYHLDEIIPEMRAHPDVLQLRCKIYVAAGSWEMVVELGRTLQGH
jgi:uncharacterized protein HemY